ncbi:hypothetical protein SSP24_50420 [Streptomyces spinoverrucosus]|uniref:Luciferase-like domain-containing protein n=1 Tax=Streptomyces spinoverrucosus TaxID=284043 RepID=A0A4Y3VKL6_9ACTN|nr:hypothetical protein SSP24_50420 [Streptomyces spinoverrucosus]GHB54944.1 hypothetical protein GCM10010397_26630 [Streptomyces spinoverrucosus]
MVDAVFSRAAIIAGREISSLRMPYMTLAYLAAHTSTVRLGSLVTEVTCRRPGLLAWIATTLDVLSGGRATLGIGAAWYDREHHGLGAARETDRPGRPGRPRSDWGCRRYRPSSCPAPGPRPAAWPQRLRRHRVQRTERPY